jgi:hypothetical protein
MEKDLRQPIQNVRYASGLGIFPKVCNFSSTSLQIIYYKNLILSIASCSNFIGERESNRTTTAIGIRIYRLITIPCISNPPSYMFEMISCRIYCLVLKHNISLLSPGETFSLPCQSTDTQGIGVRKSPKVGHREDSSKHSL